jgi:hypothetical protein
LSSGWSAEASPECRPACPEHPFERGPESDPPEQSGCLSILEPLYGNLFQLKALAKKKRKEKKRRRIKLSVGAKTLSITTINIST